VLEFPLELPARPIRFDGIADGKLAGLLGPRGSNNQLGEPSGPNFNSIPPNSEKIPSAACHAIPMWSSATLDAIVLPRFEASTMMQPNFWTYAGPCRQNVNTPKRELVTLSSWNFNDFCVW